TVGAQLLGLKVDGAELVHDEAAGREVLASTVELELFGHPNAAKTERVLVVLPRVSGQKIELEGDEQCIFLGRCPCNTNMELLVAKLSPAAWHYDKGWDVFEIVRGNR